MNDSILAATDIRKTFGAIEVVKGVSVDLQRGEFVSLVGKSGSGKTTLLALLSGLERPTSGQATLYGKDIVTASEEDLALFRRANLGFIFQSFQLIPTLTAWENVAAPLFPEKMAEAERWERSTSLLRQMQMEHRIDHLPGTLSGGEKQRVAIARALVNRPQIIFADEPTGNLDSHTGQAIMEILTNLHQQQGMTILMVTHDLELSKSADRLLRMQDGAIIP